MGQRNVLQAKGRGDKPKRELNKTKISNLTDTEFKVIVIKLLISLKREVDKLDEDVRKGIEIIKMNQLGAQNTLKSKIH